jgi:hypothetical protein
MAAGTYTLTAVAYDNAGASTKSSPVTITVAASSTTNRPPVVTLASLGTTYTAPASITMSASASDPDGTVKRVDFYSDQTLLGSDSTSPYSFVWANVGTGTYNVTAVARDDDGATTVSGLQTITVKAPQVSQHVMFTPSANDATAVDRYVFEIFPYGANPDSGSAFTTQDLGKPAVVNGECSVDITDTLGGLPAGKYIARVTAEGQSGSASSSTISFTR